MISVEKGKLKAQMLEYFRRVEETGEEGKTDRIPRRFRNMRSFGVSGRR